MSKTKWHSKITHSVVVLLVVTMVLVLSSSPVLVLAASEVTFRSAGSSPGADSTSCVINKPAGLAVGDLMIAQVHGAKAASAPDIGTFTACQQFEKCCGQFLPLFSASLGVRCLSRRTPAGWYLFFWAQPPDTASPKHGLHVSKDQFAVQHIELDIHI